MVLLAQTVVQTLHQANMASNEWQDVLNAKQGELSNLLVSTAKRRQKPQLQTAFSANYVSRLQSFQIFHQALEDLCLKYSQSGVTALVTDKLYPHFSTLRTFSAGISAATQSNSNVSLCWGCILIVIECGCIFTEHLRTIIDELADLQNLIPDLVDHRDLYPSDPGIRFALKRIFEDYVNFCIHIVRFIARPPIVNTLKNLVSSGMARDLKAVKEKLSKNVAHFRAKTTVAAERRLQEVHYQTSALALSQKTLANQSPHNAAGLRDDEYPVDTVSLRRNDDFIGRENLFNDIRQFMTSGTTKPNSCLVHSIGGYGKTQLALEATHRAFDDKLFDAVFWVEAENEIVLLRSFGTIGRTLKLFEDSNVGQPQIEKIIAWLKQTEKRWLLVFDNVVEWNDINPYWPTTSKSSSFILATAQVSGIWAKHRVALGQLDTDDGSELLCRQLGPSGPTARERSQAQEISRLLGGSPLWLNQACGLMKHSHLSFAEFIAIHQDSSNVLGSENVPDNWRYGKPALNTFDRVLDRLSSDSRTLLFMLAFMNPEMIEEDMLLAKHRDADITFIDEKNKLRYFNMITQLSEYNLVSREKLRNAAATSPGAEQTFLKTHKSLQEGLLCKLNKDADARQTAFDQVISLLREQYPPTTKRQQPVEAEWPLTQKLLPHILNMAQAFERSNPPIKGSFKLAELLADIGGINMYDRGFTKHAQRLLDLASDILDHVDYPHYTPTRGNIGTVLGLISDTLGITKRVEGENLRRQTLDIRLACHEKLEPLDISVDDEILLFNAEMDLACSLQQFNRFSEVRSICEKCLVHYKRWGTEDEYPYEYAKYYNHISYCLMYEGEIKEAVQAAERGSNLMSQGQPGSQMAVTFRFDWATLLFQSGETDRAIVEHQQLLESRIQGCGELNSLTLQSRIHLGIMYFLVANYQDAESWLREALSLGDEINAPREDIARLKYYLARTLDETNKTSQEAEKLFREARDELHKLLLLDGSDTMRRYMSAAPDYPILFDYIVTWESRLITPRASDGKINGSKSSPPESAALGGASA